MDPVRQGDVSLLQHPASQELLRSKIPARLAYVWTDGSPRVVPIWFHWNGREIVMASPPKAPKLKALASNPKVAITIDDNTFPHKVLLIRGTAKLENVSGIVPEYEAAASRYFRTGQRLAHSTASTSEVDGANHRDAAVGRTARFPNPFSQCADGLTSVQAVRPAPAFPSSALIRTCHGRVPLPACAFRVTATILKRII
jgi:hypothetical protein